MKCAVVYYTMTGNTEKVAKAIQKGIQETGNDCDLLKIRDTDPTRLHKYDLIGIGSPAFVIEPTNVSKFIEDMRFVGGKHAFMFCTHGTHPEIFFPSIYPKVRIGNWWSSDWRIGTATAACCTCRSPIRRSVTQTRLTWRRRPGSEGTWWSAAWPSPRGDTSAIPGASVPPPPPPADIPVGPDAPAQGGREGRH